MTGERPSRTHINDFVKVYTTHQPSSWALFFQLVFQNLNLNYFTGEIHPVILFGGAEAKKATIPEKDTDHPFIL